MRALSTHCRGTIEWMVEKQDQEEEDAPTLPFIQCYVGSGHLIRDIIRNPVLVMESKDEGAFHITPSGYTHMIYMGYPGQ